MRTLLLGLGLVAGAIAATPAQAQNYPWCAYYGGDFDGTNCGFVSFDQCMADVSGIGGFCQLNNLYVAPSTPAHQRHRQTAK